MLALAGFAAGVEYSISALTGDGEVLAAIACATDVAATLDCKCLYIMGAAAIQEPARSSLTRFAARADARVACVVKQNDHVLGRCVFRAADDNRYPLTPMALRF